jgi:hypothetical protein
MGAVKFGYSFAPVILGYNEKRQQYHGVGSWPIVTRSPVSHLWKNRRVQRSVPQDIVCSGIVNGESMSIMVVDEGVGVIVIPMTMFRKLGKGSKDLIRETRF